MAQQMSAQGHSRHHHRFLRYTELGSALAMVRDADIWWAVKSCLLFIAFTGVRSSEARGATWDEIDLHRATWTIPASRMKNRTLHRVPLSDQAMQILAHAPRPHRPKRQQNLPPSARGPVYRERRALQAPEKAGDTDGAARVQVQLPELDRGTGTHPATRGRNVLGALPDRHSCEGVHDLRLLQRAPDPHAGVGRLLDRNHGAGHTRHGGLAKIYVKWYTRALHNRWSRAARRFTISPTRLVQWARTSRSPPPRGLVSLEGSTPGTPERSLIAVPAGTQKGPHLGRCGPFAL